jgi:uncharacterized protein
MAMGGGIGALVLGLLAYFLGIDPEQLPQQVPGAGTQQEQQIPADDSAAQFVSVVLKETEDTWAQLFQAKGRQYQAPKLILFTNRVQSACGMAGAASGPFYCPGDRQVYIDLSFYRLLKERLGAPGDFAQAYVIAHEVGHHVQNLLGLTDQVDAARRRGSERDANEMSVRLELQADYFAGVWAHYANKKGILDPGDIEEALNAATAIGDDKLQKESQGYVVPDAFTHGTSEQRYRWFKKGYDTGDPDQGNTFQTDNL